MPTPVSTVQPGPSAGARHEWVDTAKGIGIFLVVFGHALGGLSLYTEPFPRALHDWIYTFHMPLFFALSGFFAARLAHRTWPEVISDRLRGLVYPYLVWCTLQTAIQVALAGKTNTPATLADLVKIPIQPMMQFWFLYALLLISLVYVVLVKAGLPTWAVVLVALGVHFVPDFGATALWAPLGQLKFHLVHFAIGVAAGPILGLRVPRSVALLLAVVGFALLSLLVSRFWPNPTVALALGAAILGSVATCLLAIGLERAAPFLRTWGSLSLQIFVAHTLSSAGVRILLGRVLGVQDPWIHLVGGTAAGIGLPLLLVGVCHRMGFEYAFSLRPSSKVRELQRRS